MSEEKTFTHLVKKLIRLVWVLILCVVTSTGLYISDSFGLLKLKLPEISLTTSDVDPTTPGDISVWEAPDTSFIPLNPNGKLIRYGRELIEHTSVYLGPKGKVRQMSNGMNCQNCHLDAGTKPFANNFAAVRSRYPKKRKRSGIEEDYIYRVNGCFERSMNGEKLEPDSREMKAIVAYLKWVGQEVGKDDNPGGLGTPKLKLLNRPADPEKGKLVYIKYCQDCHGKNGEGLLKPDGSEYIYPPLYGENSFNVGAGMYRLTQFAEYVKGNMPFGVSYYNPVLTDEQAWDVAAFVNSQPRPGKDLSEDWKDIADKPYDHPFGPYADSFSEEQHKYGPFEPIIAAANR